jgi:BRCT domain type II-containing protein
MISDRVKRILIAKDAPFTEEEMENMSDREAWAWIYSISPPKKSQDLPEICFTGFGASRKAELQGVAKERGFRCVTRVTKDLAFLCAGENAGPTKIKEAAIQGVPIISEEEFMLKEPGK